MDNVYEEGRQRFAADPSKCFQRHLRELRGEREGRSQIESLKGARVERLDNKAATTVIEKYEWLKKMGAGTKFCYGLFIDNELLGVCCFNTGGSPEARHVCKDATLADKTICLCRGACVPHAPKDAGSFLVRHACRLAHKDFGYEIFFAYSDPEAGEIGTIYQAVGWKCLGQARGEIRRRILTLSLLTERKLRRTRYTSMLVN